MIRSSFESVMLETDKPDIDAGLFYKFRVGLTGITHFSKRHRGLFIKGSLAAIAVVAARLALPWPLRAIAEIVASSDGAAGSLAISNNEVIRQSLLFLCCIAALGLFDYVARLFFSRFSIATTRDLRQAAFSTALGIDVASRKAATGDLVSRLIGDAGRVKAGMQGFLLHVATNGLLFAGVTVILFTIDPRMGMLFGFAAIVTGAITIWGARSIFRMSLQHRRKEGQLANKIHSSLRKTHDKSKLKNINKTSGRYEASLTRLQGRITWFAHVIFGVTVVGSLWLGVQAASQGSVAVGDIVLFMLYALMIRGPIIRLCRQGTRTGKILGPAYRLVQMLQAPTAPNDEKPSLRLRSLKTRVELKGLRASVPADETSVATIIGPLDLALGRGERVAIVDASGVALRPLLEILAGHRNADEGSVTWDSALLKHANRRALRNQVALISADPLASRTMEPLAERFRQLSIAARQRASVRLYLEPDEGLVPDDARQVLESLSADNQENSPTTMVATRRDIGLDAYDRVVHVENGRIVFDGNKRGWRGMHSNSVTADLPVESKSRGTAGPMKILFAGYAPVHFRCFEPLYRRLRARRDVEVFLSGGLRSGSKIDQDYDAAALYEGFDLPPGIVLPVEAIREMDFDILFSAHTTPILPRSADRRIQIFHGVSFRNKAVRPENMAYDNYFVVGPYMLSRFTDAGLMRQGDPRIAEIGFMKTDALVDGSLNKESIMQSVGFDGSRPIVLYAPTGAKLNSLEIMGEDAIRELLAADKYDLLIKPHDHPKNVDVDWATYLKRYESAHCRIVSPRENVIPVLYIADMLISDASSVANEYTLLDRPILFLDTPDLLRQASTAKHSMLDLDTWGRDGGLIAEKAIDVAALVAESLADPERLSATRRKIANNLFFNQGHATDAAMAWMEQHVLPVAKQTEEQKNVSTLA